MPGEVQFEFLGGEELDRALNDLPAKMARRDGGKALLAGAEVIAEAARQLAPVSTRNEPHLKDNIVSILKRAKNTAERIAVIGFRKVVSWRAHFTEYGTVKSASQPFMRPAIALKAAEAIAVVGRELWKVIEREARKRGTDGGN